MRIGLISDTHGHLDPRVPELFAGVDHILHAGDIGPATIIVGLEQIAPVTAVLGNNDWDDRFRETEVIELAARKFLVHHIVDPHKPSTVMQRHLQHHRPEVVVFGHTHKPCNTTVEGVLYLNPGYAGKPRFSLERTVAVMEVSDAGWRVDFAGL